MSVLAEAVKDYCVCPVFVLYRRVPLHLLPSIRYLR